MLGLVNIIIVQGDLFTERDLMLAKEVNDYKPTELIAAVAALNQGVDYRGRQLGASTNYCIGASLDLGKGVKREAQLAYRKVLALSRIHI